MATPLPAPTIDEPAAHLTRAIGVSDLMWLTVAAVVNLNIVPVVAAGGAGTVWLWLAALLLFLLPQGVAVIELSRRMPAEGGVYVWSKELFGDVHGFLCGWCYWTSNLFFIPTLLFYLGGIMTYAGNPAIARLAENRLFFFFFTLGVLWFMALANIRGVGVGKWVNNAGGIGALVAAGLLVLLGSFSIAHSGFSLPASSFALRKLDWGVFSIFGVICFGLVGLELGSVMGDEIRNPKRTVPRGVLYGGLLAAVLYLASSLSVLLAVPQSDMKVIQGVMQGVDTMTARGGFGWLLAPAGLLIAISIVGSASAWLSGSARILFVSGIDRYLPGIFSLIHSKYSTPYVALIGMAAMSSLIVSISFIGQASVKEAYVTMLDLAVVLQMISYLYVFSALSKVAFAKSFGPGFFAKSKIRLASVAGIVAALSGLVVSFVPSRQVDSVWRFELKMFLTCLAFLALALCLFAYYSRRHARLAALAAVA